MAREPHTKAPTPLRIAIAASGRQHADVADAVGISPGYLSRIVNGRQEAPDSLKTAIASALGTSVAALWPDDTGIAA